MALPIASSPFDKKPSEDYPRAKISEDGASRLGASGLGASGPCTSRQEQSCAELPLQRPPRKRIAQRIIAIAAGKGGVGKSMLSAHLSGLLALRGRRVGLLDADLYGPSLATMLKVDRPCGQRRVGDKILFTPALSHGLLFMSLGLFRSTNEPAAVRAPIANSLLKQFLEMTDWGDLDDLIIDFPPGTGDIQLSLCQNLDIDIACLIGTPQRVCLHDMKRACTLFDKMSIPMAGFVLNMAYLQQLHGQITPPIQPFGIWDEQAWLSTLGIDCIGKIPLDSRLAEGGDSGHLCLKGGLKEHFEEIMSGIEHSMQRAYPPPGSDHLKELALPFQLIWASGAPYPKLGGNVGRDPLAGLDVCGQPESQMLDEAPEEVQAATGSSVNTGERSFEIAPQAQAKDLSEATASETISTRRDHRSRSHPQPAVAGRSGLSTIVQVDAEHFELVWSDGARARWNLRQLLEMCPCARCSVERQLARENVSKVAAKEGASSYESATQNRLHAPPYPRVGDFRCRSIHNIGQYALALDVVGACSMGVYSYEMLRKMS